MAEATECKQAGNACMAASDFVGAMKWYTRAIALEPKDAALYSNRSFAFLRLRLPSRALADAEEVVRRRPEWPKGHFRRAEALTQAGLHAEALLAYERGAQLDPSDDHLRAQCTEARVQETNARIRERKHVGIAAAGVVLLVTLLSVQSETSVMMQAAGGLAGAIFGAFGGIAFVFLRRQQRRGSVLAPLQNNNAFAAMQMQGDAENPVEMAGCETSTCDSSFTKSSDGMLNPGASGGSDAKRRNKSTANGRTAAMRALGKQKR